MALESNGNNVVWLNTTRPDQLQQVCVARKATKECIVWVITLKKVFVDFAKSLILIYC